MNYEQTLEYIHSVNWVFCKPGLERIRALCEALGNPQNALKYIHVAGTNGKGSFCTMLSEVLIKSGLKVGTFTSPYVLRFNERMKVNGIDISDEDLCKIIEKIKPVADSMTDKPTEFELITAAAFLYFYEQKCDLIILECGLGGRLDSTNIIEAPILSVITGIALDHTAVLGDTIEQIAREKAGIIKKDTPVLWCGSNETASAIIKNAAKQQGAPFYVSDKCKVEISEFSLAGTVFSYKEYKSIKIKLLGEYQIDNAVNVLNAVSILKKQGIVVSENAVKLGMESAVWHSRFEIINEAPIIIADGGHNAEGIIGAVSSIKRYFGDKKVNVLTGVMADKDYKFIAAKIGEIAANVYCITPNNPRALEALAYSEVFKGIGIESEGFESIKEAFFAAAENSLQNDIPLISLGSLYMYADIVKMNNEFKEKCRK